MTRRDHEPGDGHVVLLVGTYRPAVAAARALARRGRTVLAETSPDRENVEGSGGVEFSRFVSGRVPLPEFAADRDAYLDAIADEARSRPTRLHLFPFYEPVFVHLSRHRSRLPDSVTLVAPPEPVVETCIDKERALAVALRARLPALPHQVVRSHAELLDATERLGGVAIRAMTPRSRVHGRKAILCRTVADARRDLPAWPEGHERLLVQRLALGPRINVHFAARDGVVLGAVAAVAGRTDHVDGTGLGVEGVTLPLSRELGGQVGCLVGELGYTGVGLVQFLVDPSTGGEFFIEVNPRIGAHHVVADRLGLDLANLAVDLADARQVAPVDLPTPARRIRSAWTLGDLAGLRRATAGGGIGRRDQVAWLGRLVVSALRADVHATWSWRDPAPALVTWWRYLTHAARRRIPVPGGRA